MRLRLLLFFFTCFAFGQEKPIVFYNENGEAISKQKFIQSTDYDKNLDLYFENDTTQIGILLTRKIIGRLDKKTFEYLKSYLTKLSRRPIDSTQNIVINYLTAYPTKEENRGLRSGWNLLEKRYLKKLHRIANINQFWLHSPKCDNLEYYMHKRINWIEDKEGLFNILFFKYEVRDGNYILIKPDGRFFCYLGEHSTDEILENAKKYFK